MVSTYCSLRAHIVFSTKERKRYIAREWRSSFHEYLGGTVRGLEAVAEAVGGVDDHVHLLVSYRPTLALADFVRELKKASTNWATEKQGPQFSWQEGYSVFSVSASQKDRVARYIANQEIHHRTRTFRQELVTLPRRHEVEFKPEYLD